MGLQEIQNERFENSEYWPKQDSEVLKYFSKSSNFELVCFPFQNPVTENPSGHGNERIQYKPKTD